MSLKNTKVGLIGSGKMGEAMIGGLLRHKLVSASQIIASGPRNERGVELEKKYGVATETNNEAAVVNADIVVFAVKPQTMQKVLGELKGKIPEKALIVSIAAGVRIETLTSCIGSARIVRAMPNMPGRINRGITVWTCATSVVDGQRNQARMLLGTLGSEVFVEDEKYLDMATALSGSGPAYVFLFMEALVDAGVRLGLSRHLATQLVIETTLGSSKYAQESEEHLARLRSDVTSPAGTTAEALYELDKSGFRTGIANAVRAAYMRAIELGK